MNDKVRKLFYVGLFLLSFCLLACQILLTRILSLVFSYHFVFLIISVVMFGLTVGSLIVYWKKKDYPHEKAFNQIAKYSFYSGLSLLLTFVSLFNLPAILVEGGVSAQAIIYFYIPILAIPFTFFGIVFSLLLTRFPGIIGQVYAVNLVGSATGCVGAYFILNNFNAVSSACVITALCLLGCMLFSIAGRGNKKTIFMHELCLVLVLFAAYYNQSKDLVYPTWVKGLFYGSRPLYSKLNFFSYISVLRPTHRPFGWGYSDKVHQMPINTQELMILIDEGAGTVLTKFQDLTDLEYLKYDISNLPYRIRSFNSVYVMGSGGGRDLLAAALFKAKKITGVELNKDIMDIVLEKSVLFSGNIKKIPEIKIYNDDGRAFIARSHTKYDLIQSSLVDSFSAAATGSFALSENSLYTKEAWIIYLSHLTDNGILTFSRWYLDDSYEVYRLLSLAQSALNEVGIRQNMRSHMVLVRTKTSDFLGLNGTVNKSRFAGLDSIKGTIYDPDNKNGIWENVSSTEVRLKLYPEFSKSDTRNIKKEDLDKVMAILQPSLNVGTILVSKTPFSAQELDALDKVCHDLGFEVVLDERKSIDENFDRILNGNYQLNDSDADISPSTDNRPFYFYFSNFKNFFSSRPIGAGTVVLRQTCILIIILGFLFIVFPFISTPKKRGFGHIEFWPSIYFTAIGLGFMFLEIPLIQRLGLFLGHPVYGLTVVLFSLLLACGVGSYIASKINLRQVLNIAFPCLLVLILFMALGLPILLWQSTEAVIPIKVLLSGLSVVLIGIFMGMFFPTGVSVVSRKEQSPLIFYWAINGFSSMCAAAFATIFLINLGFCTTLYFAFLFYFIAFWALKKQS